MVVLFNTVFLEKSVFYNNYWLENEWQSKFKRFNCNTNKWWKNKNGKSCKNNYETISLNAALSLGSHVMPRRPIHA